MISLFPHSRRSVKCGAVVVTQAVEQLHSVSADRVQILPIFSGHRALSKRKCHRTVLTLPSSFQFPINI